MPLRAASRATPRLYSVRLLLPSDLPLEPNDDTIEYAAHVVLARASEALSFRLSSCMSLSRAAQIQAPQFALLTAPMPINSPLCSTVALAFWRWQRVLDDCTRSMYRPERSALHCFEHTLRVPLTW